MKIDLNLEATNSIKELMNRFKAHNEFIPKRLSPLVSALIIHAQKTITDETMNEIAARLIPDSKRSKAIFNRYEKLYINANADQLLQLEKSLEKFTAQNSKKVEKIPQK